MRVSLEELRSRLGRWSAGRGPLSVLLAARLRQMIDDGELVPDAVLPPDRTLAAGLSVGRTTVVAAYDLLAQEGRIVRRQGSGTRVAPAPAPLRRRDTANPLFRHLLEPADHVIQLVCAAPDAMPAVVADAYATALRRGITDDIGYHPAGHPRLRAALAERYAVDPATVLVTTGAQQALSLIASALVAPGDRVVVEAPTYPGALEVFRDAAAVLRPVPTTMDGLDVGALVRALGERPALAYLVPTNHNPTGTSVSDLARRRIAAAAAGTVIVEDEALADLGFTEPLPAISRYAPDRVLTIGSLAKTVWGGLRIGWVRGPEPLIRRLARAKAVHDLGTDVPAQLAAAELVSTLDDLRAQRAALLRHRHDHLCALLRDLLPTWRFRPADGGQTLWVELPHGDGNSYAQTALRHGVAVLSGTTLDPNGDSARFLRIPFLSPPDVLTDATQRLASAWREYAAGPRSLVG
ncbi:PLP-dependent aminotransferase family protein [Actinokineospora sp. UTMC 2448]|uniref:aminotransferase-like domain-containing protein n=1 Tax=Actinokineospora sp. UTMC 2448 TaxID=2268449 RepID=UPI002164C4AE|nr:PLP-dependent aminotransferase family protein [Actinokineospora sp. UTMC 2448]UVS78160.1 putative HTH-type transcriptional regulator YdcR [Actinokineospora sp. UTMC 2448]